MALNFSHRPIFPAHLAEDNLVSPIRIANGYLVEGLPEKNGEGFGKTWLSNREVDDRFDYGRDRCDRNGSQESVSNDVLDLLPSDPFGMDISTTFTAITGWLEDLEDYGGYGRDEVGASDGSYQLFAGLNFIWNNAMRFQGFSGTMEVDNKSNVASGLSGCSGMKELRDASCHGRFGSDCNMDDILGLGNETLGIAGLRSGDCWEGNGICSDGDIGAPHAAFNLALNCLGWRDLLVVETVCRSLRSTVRAQGSLQCLSLVECTRITDDGLKRVLESNPRLTKLSVPGCTRLSIEGIVSCLKAFQSVGTPGVKHLRIGGLYGVTLKHFEELKFLLGMDSQIQQNAYKPHFYNRGNVYLSCDDDRAIDLETCPRCQNLRLVYDCPAEGCQGKEHATQVCRACTLCIARCSQCGCCINDSEYEETFCLELLCSECGKQPLKC